MKRIGYIYEKMAEWDNIVEAESKSTKRKTMNYGVKQHIKNRIKYLCEIQQNVLGGTYKLIVNTGNIKSLCEDMLKNNVTKFATVFIDKGGRRYDTDHEQTEILAVGGRDIEADEEGYPVYSDTKEKVTFNQ